MKQRTIILIAFVVCLVPRIILTSINKTANDDHIAPILLWNEKGIFPETKDCWECFQPPFYYGVVKSVAEVTGATTEDELRVLSQWMNFTFGVSCLLLVFFFQFQSSLSFKWNLSLALFWGLNPKLIAISIQATNDIPVIVFGMLFTILLLKCVENKSKILFVLLLLTVLFASILKGNGLVLFFVFHFVLMFLLITKQISFSLFSVKTVLLLALIPLIAFWGGYYGKHKKYGNPFLTNLPVAPAPNFFTPDSAAGFRKGVTTVWDSFFSFKIKSLIEQPYNVNDLSDNYPAHRTSFFTQLYGQFSNTSFERAPPSWSVKDETAMNFMRANYLLQLPLALLFLLGIFAVTKQVVKERSPQDFIHLAIFFIYLAFVARYAYNIRDFANMKLIFLFPALLSMVYLFKEGVAQIKNRVLNNTVIVLLNLSTLLCVINLIYFHIRLFQNL
ncbi:MAG: hypothetical protein POELPBGB_03063 [Bacteroidia bacterium]|nr:hypothetical protein [Bacteroidia bacterium]